MSNEQMKTDNIEDVQFTEVNENGVEKQPEIKQETPTNQIKNAAITVNPGMKLDKTGKPNVANLTPADLQKYKQIGAALNPTDPNSILNYGQALQNKLAGFSDTFLNNVRAFDAGEIGGTITDLLANVNMIEIDPSSQPMLKRMLMAIPGMKNVVMSTKKMFQKYDTVSKNIDGITAKLDHGRLTLVKDNQQLEKLFTDNVQYIKDLEDLIIAGHITKTELDKELAEMEANAEQYEDYVISDKKDYINRLSKRLTDMQLTRLIVIQSLPQIRLVQTNNSTMMDKIQASVSTTIPLWRNTLSVAVALNRQAKMAEVVKAVGEATNTMLIKNAENLKTNSIEIAKQNEKGVVEIETLRKVQTDLISTLNDIRKIKEEGEIKRATVGKELEQLESALEREVLGIAQKNTDN
jgi:uncharacterized protein YaaN involved in tellurite resistance